MQETRYVVFSKGQLTYVADVRSMETAYYGTYESARVWLADLMNCRKLVISDGIEFWGKVMKTSTDAGS